MQGEDIAGILEKNGCALLETAGGGKGMTLDLTPLRNALNAYDPSKADSIVKILGNFRLDIHTLWMELFKRNRGID